MKLDKAFLAHSSPRRPASPYVPFCIYQALPGKCTRIMVFYKYATFHKHDSNVITMTIYALQAAITALENNNLNIVILY